MTKKSGGNIEGEKMWRGEGGGGGGGEGLMRELPRFGSFFASFSVFIFACRAIKKNHVELCACHEDYD